MENLTLRKAKEQEAAFLQKFARSAIDRNYRAFLGGEAVDFFIGSGASDQYIAESIGDTTLAVLRDEVVGMCVCKDDLIDLVMVRNDRQGQGIGSAFIDMVSKGLLERYPSIRLECFEKNIKANHFYVKNGWTVEKSLFDEELGDNRIFYTK